MEEKQVCLLTGASSGIGNAIAKSLISKNKYEVVITARREEKLQMLQAEGVSIMAGDLNSRDFQDQIEQHIFDTYGRCDYLFNCAGMIEAGAIEEIDLNRLSDMLRLNIESTFILTYKFLKRFKQQGHGHVINISSVLGTKVRPTAGAYAASKFAMEALSEALRMELSGSNIQVSCIEPGLVMTELHDHWDTHPSKSMGIDQPLSVEDVVESVEYIMNQPGHVRIPRLMILPRDHNI